MVTLVYSRGNACHKAVVGHRQERVRHREFTCVGRLSLRVARRLPVNAGAGMRAEV